jgi:hypothetical protein
MKEEDNMHWNPLTLFTLLAVPLGVAACDGFCCRSPPARGDPGRGAEIQQAILLHRTF